MGQDYQPVVSLPAHPPEIWSSFVSFATFSTSVMSSMLTFSFYSRAFATPDAVNIGLVVVMSPLALLVFHEITIPSDHPASAGRLTTGLLLQVTLLRVRFSCVALVLSVIFVGMVVTRVGLSFGSIVLP